SLTESTLSFGYQHALALVLLLLHATGSAASSGLFTWGQQPDLLEAAEVFTLKEVEQQDERYTTKGRVSDGYYVYRHSLKLVDDQGEPVELELSAGKAQHDEFFGDTEIYTGDMLELGFPADTSGPLTLHWQGCAEVGFCYPPETLQVDVAAAGTAPAAPAPAAAVTSSPAVDDASSSAVMGE